MQMFVMPIQLSTRRVKTAVIIMAVLNIFWLGGSWLFTHYYRSIGSDWGAGTSVKYLLIHLNLATENVTAVWYSAMLLLLVGLMSGLCFAYDKKRSTTFRDEVLSYGWLLFGAVFVLLSLDEMGSLHERLGMLAILNPFGDYAPGWIDLLIVPIGLVALFMLLFGWVHIRRSRRALAFMIVGVTFFLTIPLQEKIEVTLWHSFGDRDAWLRPIWHLVLEEGTEIFGSLFFFAATAVYLLDAHKKQVGEARPFTIKLSAPLKNVLMGSAAGILLMGIGLAVTMVTAPYLSSGDVGIAQNWFPSTIAAVAALLSWLIWENTPRTKGRWVYLGSVLFFVALSGYYGAYMRGWLWGDSTLKMAVRYIVTGGLGVTAVLLSLVLATRTKTRWGRIGFLAWPVLFLLAMIRNNVYGGALDFVALSVLLFALLVHLSASSLRISV